MLQSIYAFEIYQQLRRPFIWIASLLMFFQGFYYMNHAGQYYANEETYANAPIIFYTVFAGVGYVGFIVTAIIAGGVLTKDLQRRVSGILFTTSASEKGYFWGRYWAGFTTMIVFNLFYLSGVVCYNFLPVKDLGPLSFESLLLSMLYILIPNTFIIYTLCFSAAAFSRSAKSAYLASMFVMLLMIFTVSMKDINRGVAVYDPTSFSIFSDLLEHMSPKEKNTFTPLFFSVLIVNRLAWAGFSLIVLLMCRRWFSFKKFGQSASKQKRKKNTEEVIVRAASPHTMGLSVEPDKKDRLRFSVLSNWRNVFSLTLTEFKSVVAPAGFKIFLGLLLVIYICYIAVWRQKYYSAAPTFPVTVEMTNVTIALSFYFFIFIIINTVELLFRNRTSEFWKIADALPVPSWVTALSKINAMVLVSILLNLCLIIFGIVVQAAKGYYHFELNVYFTEIMWRWLPSYIAYILLCAAVAGISGNKYVTHSICILIMVVSIILNELNVLEQHRFYFSTSPGVMRYTDMNGISFFDDAIMWYSVYWIFFSAAILFIGLMVWPRGLSRSLVKRFRAGNKARPVFAVLFLVFSGIFAYAAFYIYQTVNVENQFSTIRQDREASVAYEKAYQQYQHAPHPQIQHLTLQMDIHPTERKLSYTAKMELTNLCKRSIDTLHIGWADFLQIDGLSAVGNSLTLISKDETNRHAIYKMERGVHPGDSFHLIVKAHKQYGGFTNEDPQADIAFNGSFIDESFLPYFGYDKRRELDNNKYREALGVEKITSTLPEAGNESAGNFLFASTQAQRFTYDCIISTSEDQQVVMPGTLLKNQQVNDRNYYVFKSEKAIPFRFHILSANYALKEQQFTIGGKNISVKLYYHPDHYYNVEVWLQSAKEALQFLYQHLGAYPYENLMIAERPRYDENLFACGNLAILPENHGWIADVKREDDKDYLRFATTQLIAEQYFQLGNFSRVQGYPFLIKSIPRYLALVQSEQYYGAGFAAKFLKKNHDLYLAGRAKAGIKESNLLACCENEDYIYNCKGIEVLYESAKKAGTKNLLHYISDFYKQAIQTKDRLSTIDWYGGLATKFADYRRFWLQEYRTVNHSK